MAILGIPFGWVLHWLQQLIGNYGWTIIVFTVIVKLLMTPLTIKQQKSSAKMAAFQPKLQELQNRYRNNKEKYQDEMMKLYEREGYSPTNGCMPMVIQMIILFGIIEVVYRPLRYILQISASTIDAACSAIGLTSSQQLQLINIVQQGSGEKFAKVQEILSAQDILNIQNFDMNFLGLDLSQTPTLGFNWLMLIPILSCASALLMSLFTMRQQGAAAQGQQGGMMKVMMFVSPIMSLFFTFQLPAGVGLYWIISNITSFASSEIIRKIYTPDKLAELAAKDKGTERQREKMRKKREMLAKMSETSKGYLADSDKRKEELNQAKEQVQHTGKPSTSNTSNTRNKPASKSDEYSANDRIAAARKRMAEMYGDDEEKDSENQNKK